MGELRIGVSGWNYPEWRGVVYPEGLVQRRELAFLGERLNSIEINGTFYSLQSPKSFAKWAAETPDSLVFALKGSKFITHQKKLLNARVPLANFFASGPLVLGRRLGPILWQFAPWFTFDREVIEDFLRLLPATTAEAAKLARDNTIKDQAKASTELVEDIRLKYAFEPRHETFFTGEFAELLRKHNAAMAIADTAGKFDTGSEPTADHVYIRLHGGEELYLSDYRDTELDKWAKRIRSIRKGTNGLDRDVYVYFDNTMAGHAFFDAIYLAEKLGLSK
jgi:uncharacterized protein YecE (DUF72 family)